ncbi:hypothetical protein BJ742DRAFT_832404 [Cladochytrium replicatum]|nr:hypothetical protein BJ742DRAFT_832404 [Cladochytrium replicatum]
MAREVSISMSLPAADVVTLRFSESPPAASDIEAYSIASHRPHLIAKHGVSRYADQALNRRKGSLKRRCDSLVVDTVFDDLPRELAVRIFSVLPISTLFRIARVSKKWHSVVYDGSLWTSIDLQPFYNIISNAQINSILARAGTFLKSANLSGCMQFTQVSAQILSTHCTEINTLSLAQCHSLATQSVHIILSALEPFLQKLDLTGLTTFANWTLDAFRPTRLVSLNVSFCRSITGEHLHALFEHLPLLEVLKATKVAGFNDDTMSAVARCLKKLKVLKVGYCGAISDSGVCELAESDCAATIEYLAFGYQGRITDVGISRIGSKVRGLKRLECVGLRSVTDTSVAAIARGCIGIEKVDFEECGRITDEGCVALGARTSLKHVILSYCDEVTDDGVVGLVRNLNRLESLEIDSCAQITDGGLRGIAVALRSGSLLKRVEVFDCRGVSSEGIASLQNAGRARAVDRAREWVERMEVEERMRVQKRNVLKRRATTGGLKGKGIAKHERRKSAPVGAFDKGKSIARVGSVSSETTVAVGSSGGGSSATASATSNKAGVGKFGGILKRKSGGENPVVISIRRNGSLGRLFSVGRLVREPEDDHGIGKNLRRESAGSGSSSFAPRTFRMDEDEDESDGDDDVTETGSLTTSSSDESEIDGLIEGNEEEDDERRRARKVAEVIEGFVEREGLMVGSFYTSGVTEGGMSRRGGHGRRRRGSCLIL